MCLLIELFAAQLHDACGDGVLHTLMQYYDSETADLVADLQGGSSRQC